ncbi:MAG: biosynthetic arginine decarboxylase [Acidobacteria bacterium]|nr:biosynthetic arginine decarboxylase [Acidobacteriota bacterium]
MKESQERTKTDNSDWSLEQATSVYDIDRWGRSYFFINEKGRVAVRPVYQNDRSIDIFDIVTEIKARGIQLPCLIRFQDLLQTRVIELNEAFRRAIAEYGYENAYRGVYPIKVNQLHEVVEEIIEAGAPYNFGLECGSKAELLATMAHLERDDMLLICNGYKDQTMISLMLAGRQLGKEVIPVLEKRREFDDLFSIAEVMQVKPAFGVRVRLATEGSGRWAESGGEQSKFGVSLLEILDIVNILKERGQTSTFQLLHFHLGSQMNDILTVNAAVREASRVYAKLVQMGLPIRYLDIGGGLGVSYQGTRSGREQDINYTLQEYVNGVVYTVKEVCDAEHVPHPILVSESGRSITAYHSVLVVGVLGAPTRSATDAVILPEVGPEDPESIRELADLNRQIEEGKVDLPKTLEIHHDAEQRRGEANTLFSLGYLSLQEKARMEQLYWRLTRGIVEQIEGIDEEELPEDLRRLHLSLTDQYICDFSVFQSMLDHWAIDQLFPVMPLHRLNERPTCRGILVDLTCDSDGKVDTFVDITGPKPYLDLHVLLEGEPYYLGFFLMGAYQDILGDMHNLFGRVNEVHVYADPEEPHGFYIEKFIPGTTVEEAVQLVQYFSSDLKKRMDKIVQRQVKNRNLRAGEGMRILEQYNAALTESTYYNFWTNGPPRLAVREPTEISAEAGGSTNGGPDSKSAVAEPASREENGSVSQSQAARSVLPECR